MLFGSTVFLLYFLPLLLLCYFAVPARFINIRNAILLIFSLVFYAWGGVRCLFLLLASVTVNYTAGLFVKKPGVGRAVLAITVTANLAMLGVFKYAGFAASILKDAGLPVTVPNIVLPIGISFFTFQSLSYVIDVYRGDAAVQKNPLKVALYVALFPQLVAGPIVRYTTVEKELSSRKHTVFDFSEGSVRFALGLGKKMLIANAMGEIADKVFSLDCGLFGTAVAWVGIIAYTLQIYFDFSAYSDMAIGLGRMFGFRFMENFNYPYIASSVTDFWRRWHISLSSWFRDYVYIPLGGNRCSKYRHIINLLITWALTGLWHGANWTFIAWGLYFGIILIVEKYALAKVLPKIPGVIRHALTLVIVMISWVIFRSDTISQAVSYVVTMFGASGVSSVNQAFYFIRQYLPEFILALIAVFPIKNAAKRFFEKRAAKPVFVFSYELLSKGLAILVLGLSYMKLVSGSFNPFIYFQF